MSTEIIPRGIQGWHRICVGYDFLAKSVYFKLIHEDDNQQCNVKTCISIIRWEKGNRKCMFTKFGVPAWASRILAMPCFSTLTSVTLIAIEDPITRIFYWLRDLTILWSLNYTRVFCWKHLLQHETAQNRSSLIPTEDMKLLRSTEFTHFVKLNHL